ncbi:MAG TPA: hypothetical protein VN442_08640 [Bryobacteraceae bacterium]|nr:hypothetical protein [Bryobacteraceae bacterium]
MQRDVRRKCNLENALKEFESLKFPNDCDDEELSELHAELALLDGHVVGLVQSLLNGQRVPISDFQSDDQLRRRLQQAADSEDSGLKIATEYLNYLSALERLIAAARLEAY